MAAMHVDPHVTLGAQTCACMSIVMHAQDSTLIPCHWEGCVLLANSIAIRTVTAQRARWAGCHQCEVLLGVQA